MELYVCGGVLKLKVPNRKRLAKECAFPEELTGTPPAEVQSEPGKEIVFSMLEPEQLNHYVRSRKN